MSLAIRDDRGVRSLSRNERAFTRDCALSSRRVLRVDGRKKEQVRPVRLQLGRWDHGAECTVQWGATTRVTSLCTAELIRPSLDRPNEGMLNISVELSPMASPAFRQAPPFSTGQGGPSSIPNYADSSQRLLSNRILRCLERIILVGGALDTEALCLIPSQWVWRFQLALTVLDDGGNLMDACVLAALASLRHYRKPQVEMSGNPEDGNNGKQHKASVPVLVPSHIKEPTPLPLHHTPLAISFAFVPAEDGGRNMSSSSSAQVACLVDPTDREELLQTGSLTVAMNIHAEVCLLDYGGGCELPPTQLQDCWKMAEVCIKELCAALEKDLEQADLQAQKDRLQKLQQQQQQQQQQTPMSGDPPQEMDLPPVPFFKQLPGEDMEVDMDPNNSASKDEIRRIESEAEEKYRQEALDFTQGYKANKVREDNDPMRLSSHAHFNQASKLMSSLLKSAQQCSSSDVAPAATNLPPLPTARVSQPPLSHALAEVAPRKPNAVKQLASSSKSNVSTTAVDSDEEETTVLLHSEFQMATQPKAETPAEPKEARGTKKVVLLPIDDDDDEDDDIDLAMAVTKKKSNKAKKKTKK